MNETPIDERTLRYLEAVSGKKGEAAVEAWMRFTGWGDSAGRFSRQTPPTERRARAVRNARMWFAECNRNSTRSRSPRKRGSPV